MYGMPQPNSYGQYGFGAYGGFPNQAGAAGTPGAAAPGMGSPVAAAAAMGMGGGASAADPSANAAQWGGADPNSYYSNYWGGKWPADSVFCCCVLTVILRLLRSTSPGRSSAPRALTAHFSQLQCSCHPWVMFCQSVRVRPCLYIVRSPCTISSLSLSPQNFCFIRSYLLLCADSLLVMK